MCACFVLSYYSWRVLFNPVCVWIPRDTDVHFTGRQIHFFLSSTFTLPLPSIAFLHYLCLGQRVCGCLQGGNLRYTNGHINLDIDLKLFRLSFLLVCNVEQFPHLQNLGAVTHQVDGSSVTQGHDLTCGERKLPSFVREA